MKNNAKDLYHKLTGLGQRLGPFVMLNDDELKKAQPLQAALYKILAEGSVDGLTFYVPSAYHAALVLRTIQQKAIYGSPEVYEQKSENVVLASSKTGPILFRGHSSTKYELIPTLLRKGVNKKLHEVAQKYFCKFMCEFFSALLEVSLDYDIFASAAQHYEIKTKLLDFTADPDVAVYFASKEKKVPKNQNARVYILPIRSAIDKKLRIFLPPPLFERIYIQRGVFLEIHSKVNDSDLFRIEFPADSEFEIYRMGKLCNVELSSEWIEKIIEWTFETARKIGEFRKEELKKAWMEVQLPENLNFSPEMELAKWVDFYSEMRYWLAATIDEKNEYFAQDLINVINENNSSLFELHEMIRKKFDKSY